jgi:GTP cyclohydrolase I
VGEKTVASLVATVADWMRGVAPLELSEPWDNTGLLLGDQASHVRRVMTCLTLTPESAAEAVNERADLVIAHHPLPFKPVSSITTQCLTGRLLWQLARAGISVYSPHTAWDSAPQGINAQLAHKIGLQNCRPIIPNPSGWGAGRMGELPQPKSLKALIEQLQQGLPTVRPRGVDCQRPVTHIAIACGSGGGLLEAAIQGGCDLFLTGEATFHSCLEAQAANVSLLLIGHFASERFAMEQLAVQLSHAFPDMTVWASKQERDPVTSFE